LKSYGWQWDPAISVDENLLDLAFLVARNSTCLEGKVGCLLVRGLPRGPLTGLHQSLGQVCGNVIIATTNNELLRKRASDRHAEANAVALCAAKGIALEGASAYVIIPPCKNCYTLLATAGIRRIVTRAVTSERADYEDKRFPPDMLQSIEDLDIDLVKVVDTEQRIRRREKLGRDNEDWARVRDLRADKRMRRLAKNEAVRNTAVAESAVSMPATPAASGLVAPAERGHPSNGDAIAMPAALQDTQQPPLEGEGGAASAAESTEQSAAAV
ncbi:hypothetical protein JKP88DRAFT_336946, partial [Tribonema minus]